MAATSEDVAQRAGVSRGAVSQILNGRGQRFPQHTRDRVHQAARDLGYRPSIAARALARGSSDIVIALIPDTTFGANFQDIFEGLTDQLAQRGLTLLLQVSPHSTKALERVLTDIKPRAVLALGGFSALERSLLHAQEILAIEGPDHGDNNPVSHIATTQANHLIERGYKRLAFAHLEDRRQELYGSIRETAFIEACKAHSLAAPTILSLDLTMESARHALRSLTGPGFGVACYNDDVATALLAAAHEQHWQAPQDIGLIGLDHTPLSQLTSPPLTTIEYDLRQVTQGTTDWALAELDGTSRTAANLPLPLHIVQGGTT